MTHHYAIVMAGGAGTRFWPASRRARPKQFLPFLGSKRSLLQATYARAVAITGEGQVLVVGAADHADVIREQLPALPERDLLLEPVARNTAPCLGWAANRLQRRDPQAVAAALPADAFIANEAAFHAVAQRAFEAASNGDIVTVGVRPSRPETGYGYLQPGDAVAAGVLQVRDFVEKPDAARAQQLVASGHLWNAGLFFFRADSLLSAIQTHLPPLAKMLAGCADAAAAGQEQAWIDEHYPTLTKVSIDHGVMEKLSSGISVVPGDFGWDDVGSWSAAWALTPHDDADNALQARSVALDASGCHVRAPEGKLVALLGVRDLVVIDTPDALLVVPRERAQEVRRIVDVLSERNDDDVL